jgi:hypothetical protein
MPHYVHFLTWTIVGLICLELSLSVAGQYQKCYFLYKNVIPQIWVLVQCLGPWYTNANSVCSYNRQS